MQLNIFHYKINIYSSIYNIVITNLHQTVTIKTSLDVILLIFKKAVVTTTL